MWRKELCEKDFISGIFEWTLRSRKTTHGSLKFYTKDKTVVELPITVDFLFGSNTKDIKGYICTYPYVRLSEGSSGASDVSMKSADSPKKPIKCSTFKSSLTEQQNISSDTNATKISSEKVIVNVEILDT